MNKVRGDSQGIQRSDIPREGKLWPLAVIPLRWIGNINGRESLQQIYSLRDFRKAAEFAEKYFRQAMRISISGRIQTGSYTNRDGHKVYTTEVIVEEQEFAESKRESQQGSRPAGNMAETGS